jgi:hypothetical protein
LPLDSEPGPLPPTPFRIGFAQDKYVPYTPSTERLIHSKSEQTERWDTYEEDFAAAFATLLFERPEVKPWAVFALDGLSISQVDQRLSPLLKDYAIELWKVSCARSNIVSSFAVTLRRSRHMVALDFGTACGIQDGALHSRVRDDRLPLVNSKDIQEFLLIGRSFQRLLYDMRKAFYFDDTAQMQDIESLVLNEMRSHLPSLPHISEKTEHMPVFPDAVQKHAAAIKVH